MPTTQGWGRDARTKQRNILFWHYNLLQGVAEVHVTILIWVCTAACKWEYYCNNHLHWPCVVFFGVRDKLEHFVHVNIVIVDIYCHTSTGKISSVFVHGTALLPPYSIWKDWQGSYVYLKQEWPFQFHNVVFLSLTSNQHTKCEGFMWAPLN